MIERRAVRIDERLPFLQTVANVLSGFVGATPNTTYGENIGVMAITRVFNAVIHGCTIEDMVLIGMGAVVLDGAVISKNSMVAAGSTVTPGKEFPQGVMIMGSPAKVVRDLKPEEIGYIKTAVDYYLEYKNNYIQNL